MGKFDNAKAGDKVWGVAYGDGEILRIRSKVGRYLLDTNYPLEIKFDLHKESRFFTFEGKETIRHSYPTLFHSRMKIVPLRKEKNNGTEREDL